MEPFSYECCVCGKADVLVPTKVWGNMRERIVVFMANYEKKRVAEKRFSCFDCRNTTDSTAVHELPAGYLTIRSGAAPGADTGALEAALDVGANVVGIIPHGFTHPDRDRFNLVEHPNSSKHAVKDRANVDASDALVAFVQWDSSIDDVKPLTGAGTLSTLSYKLKSRYKIPPSDYVRPYTSGEPASFSDSVLVVHIIDGNLGCLEAAVRKLFLFLLDNRGRTVMVSGPTEKTLPGIGDAVRRLFVAAFRKIGKLPNDG